MATLGLIHISDLHLGFRWLSFPMSQAHDHAMLRALNQALTTLLETQDDEHIIIVSGDVSARGWDAELEYYQRLRDQGQAWSSFEEFVALRSRAHVTDVLDIPGNHDYWSGHVLNPNINHGARNFFLVGNWRLSRNLGNMSLTLHGLCSTLGAAGPPQRRAMGVFDSLDRARLEDNIKKANEIAALNNRRSIQLIITHHSPHWCDTWPSDLEVAAHQQLDDICRKHPEVKGVLSGHVHVRGISPSSPLPVTIETRCATTTQSPYLKSIIGRPWPWSKPPKREFLHHELTDLSAGGFRWTVTPWIYDNQGLFHPGAQNRSSFTIP